MILLGGYSAVFDINPQINQNLTGDNVANIQAAPTASGNGSCRFKVADDYGVVIGIYRIEMYDAEARYKDAQIKALRKTKGCSKGCS